MDNLKFILLQLALVIFSVGLSVGVEAAGELPPVSMDGRFSGFDAIGYIERHHPGLAGHAESISHYAAYYSVNPLLLLNIVKAKSARESLTRESIESYAGALQALKANRNQFQSEHTVEHGEWNNRGDFESALSSVLAITPESAAKVISTSQQEAVSEGLHMQAAVASEGPPALDLPFDEPQAWVFNGVHTWTGDDDGSPMSSIDMVRSWSQSWGADTSGDWVAASHDGVASVYSSCFVQIQHDNGWATRYYHLDNVQVESGDRVRAGDRLANYADNEEQALCSGGHSGGPHVHFTLLKDGEYFSLLDIELNGYRFHPGETSYDSDRDRMWVEKRGTRFYAFDLPLIHEPGDNIIDYRYNGMWYSADHNGHGLNVSMTESPFEDGSRKTIFVAFYTYDNSGLANYYVGNRDFDRWRSDESLQIDMLQTAGGDFSNLSPIDFDRPGDAEPAGLLELLFDNCVEAQLTLDLDERTSGQAVSHSLQVVKLIGVPDYVCESPSLEPPTN